MTTTAPGRRLAAIVFTDIVGYSAIVHSDEALGARLLDRQRTVVRRLVPAYGGREIETAGDSFLLEFDSALSAVECVVEIQHALAADASDPKVVLRASVHLGDIEHRGKEVFGDGVNVSARLLPLSPQGGMALSAPVLAMVRQRMPLPARSIGTPTLKNISSPLEVFVVEPGELASLVVPESLTPTPPAPGMGARRALLGLAAALLVTLVAVFAVWRGRPHTGASADDKSVAVLPFANMSDDKANAYFADGMQDEILTALAKIKALKVISRTSVEQYRDKQRDLASIARALDVATVLEGGVQRAGSRVRINVQLIDARNDAHLWAESYDRDVADLFAVQSEVARRVAQSLQATLLPAEEKRLATVPTQNAKAYDLFLQAEQLRRAAGDYPEVIWPAQGAKVIALYEQALREDPQFALAGARLAVAQMTVYWFGADKSAALLAAARESANRALAPHPDLGEAHLALGLYHYWGHRDYAAALTELEKAREVLPNDDSIARMLAAVQRRQGQWDQALQGFVHAAELGPQDAGNWVEVANTNFLMRRYTEAQAAYEHAQAVATKPAEAGVLVGWAKFGESGDLGAVRTALAALPAGSERTHANDFYHLHWLERDFAAAQKAAADNPDEWQLNFSTDVFMPKALYVARAYQAGGNAVAARRAFEESRRLLQKALEARPDDPALHSAMGLTLAGLGQKAEAIREAQRSVELLPVTKDVLNGSIYVAYLAETYALTGDREHALQTLEQMAPVGSGVIACRGVLKTDPVWDSVRADPRFQKLLAAGA